MNATASNVLLIGTDFSDGSSVREALIDNDVRDRTFTVECTPRLVDGVARLSTGGIAAVLLDLHSTDVPGLAALEQIVLAAPHIPILVIGSEGDEDLAVEAIERGAQDYIQRDHIDSYTLPRVLERILERYTAEESLFFEQQRADVTLNSIGDAVLSIDLAGNLTYLNPVAERMTGWPRPGGGRPPAREVFQIIDATSREPARNPLDQAIQLDQTVGLTPNCLLIRRDGVETAIEDSASPIHDRGGQAIGAVIVFHDVSAARAHVAAGRPPRAARLPDRSAESHAAERPAHAGDCAGPPARPAASPCCSSISIASST